ncbi:MAG: NADH-quinone oxidoreductase subunit C [Acidobacteriota bacterium]
MTGINSMGRIDEHLEELKKNIPDCVLETGSYNDQDFAVVKADKILDICRFFKDRLGFDFLTDVCGAHFPEREYPFEIIFHLYSFKRNERVRLKIRLKDGDEAPSVSSVWRSADWNEREIFDMFGIRFSGHTDLRRILMPEEYNEFPLRKDFPVQGR